MAAVHSPVPAHPRLHTIPGRGGVREQTVSGGWNTRQEAAAKVARHAKVAGLTRRLTLCKV